MTTSNTHKYRNAGRGQRGFTLVELMVSTTIAVFLLGGLLTTVQSTRQAYGNQSALAQLQDNERLAMTLMADVIESAGYYPDPVHVDPTTWMPQVPPFAAAVQPIAGTANAAAPGDTITVRFAAGAVNTDNVLDCKGQTNAKPTIAQVISTFSVKANQLICTTGGIDYQLITSGIQNLQIVYGVKRGPGGLGSCTDTYVTSGQMTAADWSAVCSVQVSLTFDNPLKRPGGGLQSITITRVIPVMVTAGVGS
jgi:type IV pilus assembly protein PilW